MRAAARFSLINLLLLASLVSCKPSKPSVPSSMLSTDEMTAIMTDLQIADAAARLDILPENYKFRKDRIYFDIPQSHNTDTTRFHKSLEFYTANPELLTKIYSAVEQNLTGSRIPVGK